MIPPDSTRNKQLPKRVEGLRDRVRFVRVDFPHRIGQETIRASFSTISLPEILESVMNRTMLAAYQHTPIAAFDLCSIGSVNDFKEVSRYCLLSTGEVEKVAPDGELKSAKLSEHPYAQPA